MLEFRILSCGSNGKFQLGLGDDEDRDELQIANFMMDGVATDHIEIRPKQIVCGGNHTFILMENKELYSCGDNSNGQCGHSSTNYPIIEKFMKVPGDNWTHVGCGWECSVLINDLDVIYVCGFGGKGELGLGNGIIRTDLQKLHIDFPGKIIDLKTSVSHTIIRVTDDLLFGWGNCRKGQLGIQEASANPKKPRPVVWSPEPLDFGLDSYDKLAVGKDFTVFTKGEQINAYGKLNGLYNQSNLQDIKTMWSSFHVLFTNENEKGIKSVGNDSHGQLFNNSTSKIVSYEIGSEHGVILDDKNQIYAWGWGEHGNCGPLPEKYLNEQDQVTFRSLNRIYSDNYKVVMLGCGCATTWAVVQVQ